MTGLEKPTRLARCGQAPGVFGMAIGVLYLVAAILTYQRYGFERPAYYALLFDPNSRFSDSTLLISLFRSGGMYGGGFQYPPGAVPLIEALSRLAPNDVGLAHVAAAAGSMGLLVGTVMFADAGRVERFGAGFLAAACVYQIDLAHGQYTVALGVLGMLTAVVGAMQVALHRGMPRLALVPIVASSYPLVFSVDRGNLETFAFAFVALSAAATFGCRKANVAGIVGGVLFGLAVASKALPIVLVGVQPGRQRRTVFYLSALVGLVVTTAMGLVATGRGPFAIVTAMAGNNAPSPEGYAWGLFYQRGIAQGVVYALVETRGFDGMQAAIAPVASYLPLMGLPVLAAVVALSFVVPGAAWMRYASVASAMVLFANANAVYRASFVSIALALWLVAMGRPGSRQEPIAAVLFAAALSPYAFGSVMTPLGFSAPSDTLFGTIGILALFVFVTWRWLRAGAMVRRSVHRLRKPFVAPPRKSEASV